MVKFSWEEKLKENNPLNRANTEFSTGDNSIFKSGFLYTGYLQGNKSVGIKLAILHYHTETRLDYTFSDVQNILGYSEIDGLNEKDVGFLALDVNRGTVKRLAQDRALTLSNLKWIAKVDIFAVINEKGDVKTYNDR